MILHAEAFGDSQDLHLIPSVLDGAKENMRAIGCGEDYFVGKTLTADSNYHSPLNLKKCVDEGLDAYIPDKRFRRRDPRFEREHKQRQRRTDRLTLGDFDHHEERDEYRCPHGEVFRLQVKDTITDGVIYRRYRSDGEGCKGCELKARCIKGKKAKRRYLMVPVGSILGNLTKAMAADYLAENIRVNCVCPGTTDTPSLERRIQAFADPEKARADFIARQPMRRLGKDEEIAAAILFAASDEAAFLNGATIAIDGGMTI
ncbi:MAG: SDR family oxidoreductase [Thermodesulfobacteriota bacterium]